MNRRRFLSLSALAVPALVLDPERLLWVPGRKMILDLGPAGYRVMYGPWVKRSEYEYTQWVMTVVGGKMYGVDATVHLDRGEQYAESQRKLPETRRAERRLDALARWAMQQPPAGQLTMR